MFTVIKDGKLQRANLSEILNDKPTRTNNSQISTNLFDMLNEPKRVFESVEQHKYARMADASYYTYYKQEENITKSFNTMPELKDFVIDRELTTKNHTIFHNPKTRETVISYRGTDPKNLSDLKTDANIMMGTEKQTKRLKEAEEVFHDTVEKYGNKRDIVVTGHSLGGNQSLHIGEKFDVESHSFNPAVSIAQANDAKKGKFINNTKKAYLYRTQQDPVSVGAELQHENGANRELIRVSPHLENSDNPIGHHQINNFYDDEGVRVGEEIETQKASGVGQVMKGVETTMNVAQLGYADYDATQMVKNNTDPNVYSNTVSEDTNPIMGMNLDPDYHYDDNSYVPDYLRKTGKALRTSKRRKQDKLINLGSNQKKGKYSTNSDGSITNKKTGVKYVDASTLQPKIDYDKHNITLPSSDRYIPISPTEYMEKGTGRIVQLPMGVYSSFD